MISFRRAHGSPDARAEERPVNTRSLRHRVVLSVLALMLTLLVGLGFIVNAVLSDRLQSDLHQRLRERAGLAQALSGQGLSSQALTDRLTGAGITASVDSGSGIVVGRDQPPPGGSRPGIPRGGPRPGRAATSAGSTSVKITQDGPRLLAQVATVDGPVTLSTSLIEINHTLDTLRTIELAAGAASLLLLTALLWRVVGLALSPLDRMTALARRIRDGARGRRLRPTRPGTELGRTAVAFDAMLDSLESAEAHARAAEVRMRRFLADASHDLRTPLAGVITTAERVLREDPGRLVREQRLVELIREAQRAARLVDDLLLMARLDDDAEAPRLIAIDIATVVRTATERARAGDPSRRILADIPAVAVGLADPDALHRALGNLLDNARQATPPEATIIARVHLQNDTVVVDVTDDGPGVPIAERERIFDRFVRGDPARSSRNPGGHGLGLPIARALIRRQGGELSYVDSADSAGGATFRITLVRAVSPRIPDPAAELVTTAG